MDKAELLKIFDREQRIDFEFPGTVREKTEGVIRDLMTLENRGFIAYSNLDETTVDAAIEEQLAYFQAREIPFEWKVYDHDKPEDLRQRLQARGFVMEDPEALVVLDLQEAPDVYWTSDISCVERVTDLEGVRGVRQLEEDVWGDDHAWIEKRLAHDLQTMPDLLSVFAVRADGRIVSAAWMYYHPPSRFASLWGGSTLPDYRKRGYYTALLAARAREARDRGFRFLTVDASPMSRPILEKLGFQFLGFSTPCVWKPEN